MLPLENTDPVARRLAMIEENSRNALGRNRLPSEPKPKKAAPRKCRVIT